MLMTLPATLYKKPPVPPRPELTVSRSTDRLIVHSNKEPGWKLEFAIGSGVPGGGTAVAMHVPAHDPVSIVEPQPYKACCSGFGFDNLEWRWREYGGTQGTRASLGLDSKITGFSILEHTPEKLVFELRGSWTGVSHFTRTTTVTPEGFTTSVAASYSGVTGKDSMWWIISLFRPEKIFANSVTAQDHNTGPAKLSFTPECIRPLPPGITVPYQVKFPLREPQGVSLNLSVHHLAETRGKPNYYEYWDSGHPVGNYHMFYPRWLGSFKHTSYYFKWSWHLSSEV